VWFLFLFVGGIPSIVMFLMAITWNGAAAVPVTFWSMAPDTVEVGEWRTGARCEGVVFGIVSLGQKIALGIGIGLTGVWLDAIGYVAGAHQASHTLSGLHAMMTLPGLIAAVASAGVMWFYRLDGELHARLRRALERRSRSRRVKRR
jgi:GPH family glycoside/pentoside/hexuronide:cation symporter